MKNNIDTHNLKILIIEDSPVIMHIHCVMAQQLGYKPDTAKNAMEAKELFAEQHYDLVLSDIDLPDIDGLMLSNQLRYIEEDHHYEASYIVGITAFLLNDISNQNVRHSMSDIIPKPLKQDMLQKVIKKVFLHKQTKYLLN